ncbi:MAG: hypothetical protein GX771_09290 [Halomonadaceae bacterium]|nr:hypothetical protein [Halomonadaceae bacterium]
MSNTTLINALPIVAAALGKKHGIKVSIRPDIDTAATDGKNIYLPILPDTHEALVLARGYIDHESAHIRFTDFTVAFGKGLRKSLINILEDIRIEQRLGRELPGCRINLEELERSFVENNIYDEVTSQSHPAEILCAHIHHGLRVNVLGNSCTQALAQNASNVFEDAFSKNMVDSINELLLEGSSLRDTVHVADLADRILEVIKEDQPENQDDSQDQQQGGSQSSQGDDGSDQQQGGSQSSQGDDGSDQQQGGSQSSQGDDGGDQQQGGSQSNQGDDGGDQKLQNQKALKDTLDQEIVSNTDLGDKIAKMLGDQNFEAQTSGSSSGTFPIIAPPPNPGASGIDPSEASRETNALRTRINGLVQASKLKRSPPRRVGSRIDTRSLHKLRTLDTRVFRGREQKVAVNTGVVVLLDQSSSMSNIRRDATKAAMAVALALDTIPGIKLSIAGFHSRPMESRGRYIPAVTPMKLFNQRIDRDSFVPGALGTTPLTEGLWWASSELLALQGVERRIVVTVTDGDPDCKASVSEIIGRMKDAAIENHAIGIGVSIDKNLFSSSCSISNIHELPVQVFAMLQDMLVEL